MQLVSGWEQVSHPKQILSVEVSWWRAHERVLNHEAYRLAHVVLPFLQIVLTGCTPCMGVIQQTGHGQGLECLHLGVKGNIRFAVHGLGEGPPG